jgi:hypothetical protein
MRSFKVSAQVQYVCGPDGCTLQRGAAQQRTAPRGTRPGDELGPMRESWIDRATCDTTANCLHNEEKRCVTVDSSTISDPRARETSAVCVYKPGICNGYCTNQVPSDPDFQVLGQGDHLDERLSRCTADTDCQRTPGHCARCEIPRDERYQGPTDFQICNAYGPSYGVTNKCVAGHCVSAQD